MDANAFLSDVMQKTRLFTETHFVGRRVFEKYPSVARFRFSSKKIRGSFASIYFEGKTKNVTLRLKQDEERAFFAM